MPEAIKVEPKKYEMISEEDIALIDRFLAGELDGLERVQLERRVKNDLEFAKEIRFQQKVVDNLKIVGAARMAATVKSDFGQWKADGFQSYQPSNGMSTTTKVIIGVIAAGAIAAAAYFLTRDPHEDPPLKKEKIEAVDTAPAPGGLPEVEVGEAKPVEVDTITQNVTRLVSEGSTQTADIQLDVKDASTFNVELIKSNDGMYTYEISFDGKKQTVETDDPNLKESLMARAKSVVEKQPESN
jgi:hypothetical protein